MKGAIGVATYSRTRQLEQCLDRIVVARKGRDIPLIVIYQKGSSEVSTILSKFKDDIQVLVHTEALGESALENINLNSLLYRNIAFSWLDVDWCLGVEDDVQISSDSLDFIIEIYDKYKSRRDFRGVNLGSRIPYNFQRIGEFTKSRYGIHGQASMITKNTWSHFNQNRMRKSVSTIGLDAMMERYLKLGFMCTPYISRFLDTGWEGTHASGNPEDPYFVDIRNSFGTGYYEGDTKFCETSFNPLWRYDCTRYVKAFRYPMYFRDSLAHLMYICKSKLKHYIT